MNASAEDNVLINEAAVLDMLNGADGLVAPMLMDLAERATAVAIEKVPTRKPRTRRERGERLGLDSSFDSNFDITSDARPIGYTRSRIHSHMGWDAFGRIYSSANAPADPAIFLEMPAEQMDEVYPFLSTGLDSLDLDM